MPSLIEGLEAGRMIGVIAEDAGVTAGYAADLHHGVTWPRHLGGDLHPGELAPSVARARRTLATEISAIAGDLGLRKFITGMTPDQKGAVSTFERFGFKAQALLQDFAIDADGRTRDILVMPRDVPGTAH